MRRTLLLLLSLSACAAPAAEGDDHMAALIAHLGRPGGDPQGLQAIASSFAGRNPGDSLSFSPQLDRLGPASRTRMVFVQSGRSSGEILTDGAGKWNDLTVGDLLVIRSGEEFRTDSPVGALVFEVPDPPAEEVPAAIRPDWDPRITDTPGGCATETGAYRRILLTWSQRNGPYTYHGLNAHRVRMTDSFSHYHPPDGGFDEIYLVQMVQPGARVITSDKVHRIEKPDTVTAAEAGNLLTEQRLAIGDLVYLPRGLMHRGVGGVLAQVITVPGFVPGSEIGVDHHLRSINERLGLTGDRALPYHEAGSHAPVVR